MADVCRLLATPDFQTFRHPCELRLISTLLTHKSSVRLYFNSIRDREAKYADVCMLLCKMRGILFHFTA